MNSKEGFSWQPLSTSVRKNCHVIIVGVGKRSYQQSCLNWSNNLDPTVEVIHYSATVRIDALSTMQMSVECRTVNTSLERQWISSAQANSPSVSLDGTANSCLSTGLVTIPGRMKTVEASSTWTSDGVESRILPIGPIGKVKTIATWQKKRRSPAIGTPQRYRLDITPF